MFGSATPNMKRSEASARLYDEWVSYYEAKGVEAVSTGLIAMRRTSGRANWLRIEELPDGTAGPVGDAVALGFELARLPGSGARRRDAARRETPRFAAGPAGGEPASRPAAGGSVASARIRLASGLAYSSPVDLRLAELIARCDGQRPVRELLSELAAATNSDLEKITPNCLSLLRQLIERGFLVPR